MRKNTLKAILKRAAQGAAVLLLGAGLAQAQTAVSLTAAPANATLPDGSSVPMWGYTCGSATSGSCAALNPSAAGGWSPVVITVPYSGASTSLSITLTNNLPAPVPTSVTIVGQLGGGLGTNVTKKPSPVHDNQGTTWPIANSGPVFTPPAQADRVESFATEVASGATSGALTWTGMRPGTYLLESGTHPSIQGPMGLYGIVVVTTAPTGSGNTGVAYTGVNYAAELPLLFSEIDPVQNTAVATAVGTPGFSETATLGAFLKGPVMSINLTSGGQNYTSAPTVNFVGGNPAPGGNASATAVIDTDSNSPTFGQITEIDIVNGGNYTSAPSIQISGGGGSGAQAVAALQLANNAKAHCSGGAAACYPAVVNYTPLYYLINGTAFNKTSSSASLFAVTPGTGVTGDVLVRMVNAGLRMHVPSIVGSQPSSLSPAAAGTGGFSLVAEDGNALPGVPRIQSEVFMAAGKTYDVMIKAPTSGNALPVFDRELSLSGNAIARDSGMLGYISVNGAGLPTAPVQAQANPDTYNAILAGQTFTVADPSKGVLGNDLNVFGVKVKTQPTKGTVTLNADGTFTYVANANWSGGDTFGYCGNGATSGNACTTVTLNPAAIESASGITCSGQTFNSSMAKNLKISAPGVLSGCVDGKGFPLTVNAASVSPANGLTVSVDANGAFQASVSSPGVYTFSFKAQNAQGTVAAAATTVTLTFPQPSNLKITVLDGADHTTTISEYRWIIEEDRTFFQDPKCTKNPPAAGCPNSANGVVPNFGTNFHTSYMPLIASGCNSDLACGNNQTVNGQPFAQEVVTNPGDVGLCSPSTPLVKNCLDPNKRYYISILPADAAQPFISGYTGSPDCSQAGALLGKCGHGMGGAPIPAGSHSNQAITILTEPSPYPPATLSGFVFEDDYPLNGEVDTGGGVDIISPNEPGLGGFQITISDNAGGTGDSTGNPTYDMFNMPLSNSLAGTLDPTNGNDACPISPQISASSQSGDSTQNGITGMIVTCPKFESDGKTMSPLAGQFVVKNLWPGRYGVTANPGADRIARGEEWLQTNTLDGQKAHDSFMRIGEPGYFQEFGPAGYHVVIGFANPKIINDRLAGQCASASADCTHEVRGHVTTARMSRTPDERLYGSGTHDAYAFTQCYISLGDPDGADFAFTKCDDAGNFDFKGIPAGNWKITTFDQWNDQVVDGITTPVGMCDPSWNTNLGTGVDISKCKAVVDMGEVAVHQWQSDIYTRTFLDTDYTGVSTDQKPGLPLVATNIRFRDGSFSNFNTTDLNGYATFNEVFPLFNWYVVETDTTRFKSTGTHVIYDSGGPADNTQPGGSPCYPTGTTSKPCGNSQTAANLANTYEPNALPSDLSIPGSVYCDDADCTNEVKAGGVGNGPKKSDPSKHSTGRIDAAWVQMYGWQGFSGQANFLEFGKRPFADGENGGIQGHVVYASTRPFDNPMLLLQLSWEPLIPHVRLNLYKEGVADDGVTKTLSLIDYTETTSFDDWAQGFRADGVPNMNCPGQGTDTSEMKDPYYWFGLKDQPQYLDLYNNNGTPSHSMPHDAQFKCYDGMHNWNQLQPAPYDGYYSFPSVTSRDLNTGVATGTNCTACTKNPDVTDKQRYGTPMLPDGKYVVEVVIPPGYELVKEEDKNILIGDNFIAPATQQFGGLGSVFILPDQAEILGGYNSNNGQNPTNSLGRNPSLPSHEADTGSDESYWPCVGEMRIVPDYISLFPGSGEVAPFAGAKRPLCDRKEVTLTDQTTVLTKFYLFTPTHVASHFTGQITDDFSAEFDPYSPAFGEKFAPAYVPVGVKDWAGNEINRVYADAWGVYDGLNYSTWEVNPPNPTGYGPTMMVMCMNDSGPITDPNNPNAKITDPLFQSGYSNFCYELPFMPGQTGYFDTPVVPTSAFAGGYNTPDCSYPAATPAVAEVDGDGVGPWIAGIKGSVVKVNIVNGGSGYTSVPAVTFNNTGTGGTGVAGTAVISGTVTRVNVTNGGRGYTSIPTVTFAGGGGSGAAGTAVMTNSVASATVSGTGTYGTGALTVVFSAPPPGGTRATGTVLTAPAGVGRRRILGILINNPGAGYSGTATATLFFGGVAQNNTITVTMGQSVASVTLTSGGTGYTSAPTVTFGNAPFGGARAQGNAAESASVTAVLVTNGGSNYNSAPAVTIAAPTTGTQASATAAIEANGTITINALGDQMVDNYMYSGPSANAAPFNQQKINRHYGFGDQCTAPTANSKTCNTLSAVTIGGVSAPVVAWSDTQITVSVPAGVPACSVQQQSLYQGTKASCGELVITGGNGKQSIDTVTVTVGGKAPTHILASESIQAKIDAAQPGDLLIVDPTCTQTTTATGATAAVSCDTAPVAGTTICKSRAAHAEMLLMWKPVRLQGVGAASSAVDANPHPAGKLDPWRRQVVCLFGLSLNGTPISGTNPYDANGTFNCTSDMQFAVDRLPLEATVGWDATLNGNLAEQLIEPTIMGAYEGAGITVLAKGVKFNTTDPAVIWASDTFPTGTQLLTTSDCLDRTGKNPYPSNFLCNPSSIDGITVQNSSQGGGGIMVHAWGHNLQIANDRVYNNQGTLSGGITVGQGEHPDVFQVGNVANTVPGSCIPDGRLPANMALPYCNNMDVNVHNNYVVQNSSLGDELFSSTPAGAGGVTFCNGSDYYKFNYNWVCGNMSTGDGAGVAHVGYSYDGDIEHNTIVYNQSTNPTIVTNGGGLLIMGAPDVDPACGLTTDQDCISAPTTIQPSDGTGPGLVINANLILGNSADSGSGGGLRLQHINGTEVLNFPNGAPKDRRGNVTSAGWPSIAGHPAQPDFQVNTPWNAVNITNNIIANNVAGLDGGGISLLDALAVNIVNNTVVSNDSTATSGVLLQTLFAPLASTTGTNCTTNSGSQSCPQVAGLVSVTDTDVLTANMGLIANGGLNAVTCPTSHGENGDCKKFSVPLLTNNIIWKNRALFIGVGGFDGGFQNQQNKVTIYNSGFGHAKTATKTQASTGACDDANASYWDLGVRGDVAPGDHSGGGSLSITYSILSNPTGTFQESHDSTNILAPGTVVGSTYCNGSRLPIEAAVQAGAYGWQVPPGTNESNALPAPPFTLSAAATVDEGNNWINLRWGPLSLDYKDPQTGNPVYTFDPTLPYTSSAINKIPTSVMHPATDFFGNARPDASANTVFDIGAVQSKSTTPPVFSLAAGTYHQPQTLILTDAMPGAVIYYTTDGSTPTTLSTQYTGPITIAATELVKAIAVAPGYQPSPVSSKQYTYVPLTPTAAPFFSLAAGTYNTPQTLTLTDSTPGAVIYYTTNGSTPTTLSTKYTGPITVASTELVQAMAQAPGYDVSPVSAKQYTYASTPAAAPVFSLAAGTYQTPQSLVITDTTPGAVIYYTTNGTTPNFFSPKYTGPITVQSTETVKAVAIAQGYTLSTVTSVSYTYNPLPQAAAPFFSLAGGTYTGPQTLTLTDSTPGATIYYTTNGSAPTTSSTQYTGPITISTTGLVRAVAIAPGYNLSTSSAKFYTIQ
ncbi:hypothetical protein DYQ86_21755 [Acidobacteria bacterium AB60]|nr:hypothetical protein DYQ86_21755 [Acidobacteria bacterium AB60]